MGRRQGRRAAPRGRHDLRRRPHPRCRGRQGRRCAERVGAHRWVRSGGAPGGRHRRGARDPRGVPGLARGPPPGAAPRHPGRGPARARLGAGRLQRRRRQRVPPRRRRARARTRPGRRRDRLLPLAALGRARPRARVRGLARGGGAHPGDPRDGARGLPRQRGRPLLLLQGRAARRAHPAGRRPRARPRRDRHQRRRRRRGLPARHPGRRRARRDRPAARRRAHQGPGAGGLAPVGAAHLGQARGRVPVVAGRLRRRGHAGPPVPGQRAETAVRALLRTPVCATCGSATWATGRASRSTRRCSRCRPSWRPGCSMPSAGPGSRPRRSIPEDSGRAR